MHARITQSGTHSINKCRSVRNICRGLQGSLAAVQQSENNEHVQGAAVQETVLRIVSLSPRKWIASDVWGLEEKKMVNAMMTTTTTTMMTITMAGCAWDTRRECKLGLVGELLSDICKSHSGCLLLVKLWHVKEAYHCVIMCAQLLRCPVYYR